MEYVVLGLLMIQSMTIYQLNQAFKGSISMFYSASYGSLQSATKKLVKKQWVTFTEKTENGRNKKIYAINPAGQKAFIEWMFAPINPNKLETIILSKVFFLGLIPKKEEKVAILHTILQAINQLDQDLKQTQTELLQNQAHIPPDYQPLFNYQIKPLEYGLKSHQTARQWIQEMLNELQ